MEMAAAARHTGAQTAHGYARLGATVERKRSRSYGSSCFLGRRTTCLKSVALGDTTVPARAFNRCGVYTFFGQNLACGRRSDGRSRSEEHTSELQSLMRISYAVFCLKKKKKHNKQQTK